MRCHTDTSMKINPLTFYTVQKKPNPISKSKIMLKNREVSAQRKNIDVIFEKFKGKKLTNGVEKGKSEEQRGAFHS